MKYIESLREGERINEIYLCKTKQSALTKAENLMKTLFYRIKQESWMQKSGIRVLSESMILIRWITLLLWEISQVFREICNSLSSVSEKCRRGV